MVADEKRNKNLMRWLPEEVEKLVSSSLDEQTIGRETSKTGLHVIKKLLINAVKYEETLCGRLYLL